MQTTAATESAVSRSSGWSQPRARKIRHVKSSVATVMPEIGLDDEPISPVRRDDTVTNRKPKSTMRPAPRTCMCRSGTQERTACRGLVAQMAATRASVPTPTNHRGRSRSVRPVPPSPPTPRMSRTAERSEPMMSGRAWKRLMMPPAATSPAPM